VGSDPLVSVIIPCFDQGQFLAEAVASARSQTYKNIEIVVVDDGSAEPVKNILATLEKHPVEVRLFEHPSRRGSSAARNTAVKHSNGELILPLDADDLLAPTFLERTTAILRNDPAISCVYTDMQLFGDQSYLHKPDVSLISSLSGVPSPACVLYRRAVYDTVGGYREHIHAGEDTDFAIRSMQLSFKYMHLEEPLYLYRKHALSTSTQYSSDGNIKTVQSICNEHKSLLVEHLEEVLVLKENRYCMLKEEYGHLHEEFHKLLKFAEHELTKEIGVRNSLNRLIASITNYLKKACGLV
jgi:glycosyltransferase involved in cell wall biosynthesis